MTTVIPGNNGDAGVICCHSFSEKLLDNVVPLFEHNLLQSAARETGLSDKISVSLMM